MTLEIKVAASLMKYNFYEQSRILDAIEHGLEDQLPSKHLREGAAKVIEVFDNHDPIVEGYAGFPVERDMIAQKKAAARDDRNIGRVVKTGSGTFLITGRKADGRYQIVSKDGAKSAKAPEDIGLNLQREDVVGIDIEDLHQMMIEKKMDGVDDNGFTKCWKGYVKRGTKMKGGKEVNNCVKEDSIEEVYKGKHGQSDKEYADSRSQGGKMVSGDSKQSGAEYTHGRRVKAANPGMQPDVGGKTKPKSQGKMDRGTRADLEYRKANLAKKEEYTLGELKAILEDDSLAHLHADVFDLIESVLIGEEVIEEASSKKSQKGETLYKVRVINNDDRAEVRYASRAKISQLRANDNIKSVEITGHGDAYNEKPKKGGEKKLDPVGKEDGDVDNDGDKDSSDKYLMKRRKAIGKAMAKEEYVDENRAAARAAGGSKDDSKKQPDPSKPGFTGMGNMSIDQIRKMSARIEKEKSAKK